VAFVALQTFVGPCSVVRDRTQVQGCDQSLATECHSERERSRR
jgi:hypothetical protein